MAAKMDESLEVVNGKDQVKKEVEKDGEELVSDEEDSDEESGEEEEESGEEEEEMEEEEEKEEMNGDGEKDKDKNKDNMEIDPQLEQNSQKSTSEKLETAQNADEGIALQTRAGSRSRSRSLRKSPPPRGGHTSASRSRSRSPRSRIKSPNSRKSQSPPIQKRVSRSRTHTPPRRRVRSRSSSSSSRDTYDFKTSPSPPPRAYGEFPCRKCDRDDFESVRELCEHEIRAHNARIPCAHCSKEASSVQKLVDHLKKRHPEAILVCYYCKDEFGDETEYVTDNAWEDYRAHVYKECLREKLDNNEKLRPRSDPMNMRGRGRCPHGPPVRCKNFPKCPGDKCYYFHGYCKFDKTCRKQECPFDHSNRPRVCLSCLRDSKAPRERRNSGRR